MKKSKVDPVVGSDVKKAKLALSKQLKSLSINTSSKQGIHRKLSSSSDESEKMEVDQIGGGNSGVTKGIKKSGGPAMSRATYVEMKKVQKRLAKSGVM